MAPLSLGGKRSNENGRVDAEQGRIQSDKQGLLHYLSQASSLIEKENNREENRASHQHQADPIRAMGAAQVNTASRQREDRWKFCDKAML